MSDELQAWARVGATAVVAAIGTEAWPTTRAALVDMLARRGTVSSAAVHVDSMATVLTPMDGADRARFKAAALSYYEATLAEVLAAQPIAAADLAVLVVRVMDSLPGDARQSVQVNAADGQGHVHAVLSGVQQVFHQYAPPDDVVLPTAAGAAAGVAGALAGQSAAGKDAATPAPAPTSGTPGAPAPDLIEAQPSTPSASWPPPRPRTPPGGGTPVATTAAGASKLAAGFKMGLTALLAVGAAVAGTYAGVKVFGGSDEDCSSVVAGRPPAVVLEEATRRLDATSFAFSTGRGGLRVTGTADMPRRTVVFEQRAPGAAAVSGRIDDGVATLSGPAGVPADAVPGGVREDGVFVDAAQPTGIPRALATAQGAVRDGCRYEGSVAARTAGTLDAFTARIDGSGRLVSVTIDGSPELTAEYRDFGAVPGAGAGGDGKSPGARDTGTGSRADLSGEWRGTYDNVAPLPSSGPFAVRITQQGDRLEGDLRLSGTGCELDGPIQGTLEGTKIRFGSVGGSQSITFEGTVSGDRLSGTYTTTCLNSNGTWKAARAG